VVARNFALGPGQFAEVNIDMPGDGALRAAFRANAPVRWDVHSHPEGGVVIHQEGEGDEGAVEFRALAAGMYSCLWRNEGAEPVDLIVSVELPSGARIDSWHPTAGE